MKIRILLICLFLVIFFGFVDAMFQKETNINIREDEIVLEEWMLNSDKW